jgi:phosphoesterase RecJ-like protein
MEAIAGLRRPLVLGHVRPDVDCLASMLALARSWKADARDPLPACLPNGDIPDRLLFMLEWAQVPLVDSVDDSPADGYIAVDTARLSRCNLGGGAGAGLPANSVLINIDHHVSNTGFGTENWVVPAASSCAELIYRLLVAAERPIDEITASLLYAGQHSDTRGFTLAESAEGALSVAAELARLGARVAEVGRRIYRSRPLQEVNLQRVIYNNIQFAADGCIAYSTATHQEITACECNQTDIDDQVEIPRSIRGVRIAALFTEAVPGFTRVNLRCEAEDSVLELAIAFGGGGHATAAGAILPCPPAEAVSRIIPAAVKLLES